MPSANIAPASKVVVVIHKGRIAMPKQVFVDGREIKGVVDVDVSYSVGRPRMVRFSLYASEVEEVEPK